MGVRLGHVHLKVRDIDASVQFYEGILGMNVKEAVKNRYAFLKLDGHDEQEIALIEMGKEALRAHPMSVGLFHIAFQVNTKKDLYRIISRLRGNGISYSLVDHGISWALYFDDPDGNGMEVFLDRIKHQAVTPRWNGRSKVVADSYCMESD